MAEYISIPSKYLVHGEELSFDELALVEPLAIGAHGISRAGFEPGEYVLVMGAGPIGLGTMELAMLAGARVIAMDVNAERLSFCRNVLNTYATINAATEDTEAALRSVTDGDMPTVVIDATGSVGAINRGLDYLAHSGTYILIGLQKENFSFSHPEFHKRETTLMSSRNATREDFQYVIKCMKNNLINPQKYITRRINFNETDSEFPKLFNPGNGLIKAIINMP
jgi:threonine dehydrogenase-like Zn-dependent dehydrogenase